MTEETGQVRADHGQSRTEDWVWRNWENKQEQLQLELPLEPPKTYPHRTTPIPWTPPKDIPYPDD